MASAIKYDNVHIILTHSRATCRDAYDVGRECEDQVCFALGQDGQVFRCDDDHLEHIAVTVTWDMNNKDLRDLAREVANDLDLLEEMRSEG